MIEYIRKTIPKAELLAQLAEEAAELGHAALKLRRTLGNQNPTPVTYEEALDNLHEEIADVKLALKALDLDSPNIHAKHTCIMMDKAKRWQNRLGSTERKNFAYLNGEGEYEEEHG